MKFKGFFLSLIITAAFLIVGCESSKAASKNMDAGLKEIDATNVTEKNDVAPEPEKVSQSKRETKSEQKPEPKSEPKPKSETKADPSPKDKKSSGGRNSGQEYYTDMDTFMAFLLGADYSDSGYFYYESSGPSDGGDYGWGELYDFFFGPSGPGVKINEKGMTVETRFDVPEGYERVSVKSGSYEEFYRKLPLKPDGTNVYYYNGQKRNGSSHAAVYDFPQLKDDLLQCADSCIKMRAEYFYSRGEYGKIGFNTEGGVYLPFSKYVDGYRFTGSGWKGGYAKGASREIFDDYLRIVYSYASTRSLAKEVIPISIRDLRIGDVFLKSGSPGHSVFVTDMAVNKKTGKKIMLLGQGYMPAQDLHIVESLESISPWFYVEDDAFGCMDFSFAKGCQGRWPER